jgi:lipoate-protein ligase A
MLLGVAAIMVSSWAATQHASTRVEVAARALLEEASRISGGRMTIHAEDNTMTVTVYFNNGDEAEVYTGVTAVTSTDSQLAITYVTEGEQTETVTYPLPGNVKKWVIS